MSTTLVVPIDVAALVVSGAQGPAATGFAPAMTRFDALPYRNNGRPAPFIAESALASPFDTTNAKIGVHIHWAMPDALMRATRPDMSVGPSAWTFPELPDRWLVTRVARIAGQPDVIRSWVVDSGYVSANGSGANFNIGSSAVVWDDAGDPHWEQPPFRYLGRAVPLSYWATASADTSRIDRLDATRFGSIELAAFYPNVVNVFGLYDALDDLTAPEGVALGYSVTGWHLASGDPVAGKSADAIAALLAAYKWQPESAGTPAATAYCGMVHSVRWSGSLVPTAPQPLAATIGNTTSEALSSLIVNAAQRGQPDDDDLEFQLHALLTSQMGVLGDTAGKRLVTRQLHKMRFTPTPGTYAWYARRKSDGADISATLNAQIRARIDALNALQGNADQLRSQIADKRWQVFADWYKYQEVAHGNNALNLDPDAVAAFMQGTDQVGGPVVRPDAPLPSLEADIAALGVAQAKLAAALAQMQSPAVVLPYDIAQKPSDIYYQPSDPTLLLSGADVTPALRYGGDGLHSDDGTLACRWATSLVSSLSAPQGAVAGSAAIALGAADSPGLGTGADAPGLAAVQVAQAFLLETLLLWPDWSGAKLAAKANGSAANWMAWTQTQTTAWLAGQSSSVFDGVAPSPVGVAVWDGNPWLPIMMHWSVNYSPTELMSYPAPTAPTFDPTMIISRLDPENDSLDSDATELTLAGQLSATPTSYQGIMFITPHAGYAAYDTLQKYAADNRNSPLAPIAREITAMPLLSQALTGFHDRFLLRKRTLQVGVRDPNFSEDPDSYAFMQQVIADIDAAQSHVNSTAPMVEDSFCPVRAGSVELTRLWLVDAFGQVRDYDLQGNALSLTPARSVSSQRMYAAPGAGPAFLPPRISQPAQLKFDWLSAAGNVPTTGTQLSSTPICGWLVPNYLDESLMLYDADGTALGSIAQLDDALAWLGSPVNPSTYGQANPAAKNAHLQDFATALLKRTPDYLVAFLDTLNAASATIQPMQHAQAAQIPVLVGQPLALVQTSLTLRLMGAPAINNNWYAFQQDMQAAQASVAATRTTNGHEAVNFPVLVGSVEDPDDGLLGFYLGASYDTFYAVVATSHDGLATRKIDTVKVSIAGGPVGLTMIVDPRCAVHATTGYMPTQALQVPTEMFRAAFAKIAVTFLTAPVLSAVAPRSADTPVALPLPLPGQQKGQWSWVTVQADPRAPAARTPLVQPAVPATPGRPFSDAAYWLQDGWLTLSGFEDTSGPD